MRLFGKRNHQFYANNCWFIIDEDVNLSFLIMLKLHRNEFFLFFLSRFKVVISSSLVGKVSNMVFYFCSFVFTMKIFRLIILKTWKHRDDDEKHNWYFRGTWPFNKPIVVWYKIMFFQFCDNAIEKMIHIPLINLQTYRKINIWGKTLVDSYYISF